MEQDLRYDHVFHFASEIGDAFCLICLPNLTDVATNDDRTTEATRESVFIYLFSSVVVPPTKVLELHRFVVEVHLKFFFFF